MHLFTHCESLEIASPLGLNKIGGSFDPLSFGAAATFIGFLAAGDTKPGRVAGQRHCSCFFLCVFFVGWPMLKSWRGGSDVQVKKAEFDFRKKTYRRSRHKNGAL